METTNQASGNIEWTGVSEVVDKTQNGLYRANLTTGIMAMVLVITFSVVHLNGDSGNGGLSFSLIAFWGAVLLGLWVVTFIFGYVGTSWISGYANPRITPDTNLQPNISVIGYKTKDFALGRLEVSSVGIAGIILLPWGNIYVVRAKNSQNIELLRQEKFFGLPIGKRKIVLNFPSPEEATHFSEIATKYIFH